MPQYWRTQEGSVSLTWHNDTGESVDAGHDAEYRSSGDWSWLTAEDPDEILVIGAVDESEARSLQTAFGEIRGSASTLAKKGFHRGAYLFVRGLKRHAVIALDGQHVQQDLSERLLNSASHIAEAWENFRDLWPGSSPLLGASGVAEGQLVLVSGLPRSVGRVLSVRRLADRHEVTVDVDLHIRVCSPEDLTLLEGDPRSPSFWVDRDPVGAEQISQTLSWLKLGNPISDLLYSFATTRTTFKPYQFIPVLKLLRSATGRLLIADEVGLGKTIEAGLILTELDQRKPLRRVLVIAPAVLRYKWQDEMRRRFMRTLRVLKPADLDDFLDLFEHGNDPILHGIITLESLRAAEPLLERLVALRPDFDLVVIDEAHYLRNRNTRAFHVGQVFRDLADNMVFLSATPLNLGESDLFNLISTLDPGGFPDEQVFREQLVPNHHLNEVLRLARAKSSDASSLMSEELDRLEDHDFGRVLAKRPDYLRLRNAVGAGGLPPERISEIGRLVGELNTLGQVFTRTRKIDLPDKKAMRVASEVIVDWTPQERALYDAVYTHYRRKALASQRPTGFLMQIPLRLAASCLPVLQQHLADKEGWDLREYDVDLDGDGLVDADSEPDDALVAQVLRARIDVDTKLQRLVERLRSAQEAGNRQALIFSFFRGTVIYLQQMLEREGFRVSVLHGGVEQDKRQGVIDRFKAGEFDILVSNQVGAEGLDFQFCNVLVNYDLPWNPMQVEQRIGRLDRFGQESETIFIFNMTVPGTIESDILARLYYRIGVFERSIGALEPILRSEINRISSRLLDPHLSQEERELEIEREAIALENREQNIKDLEEASGLLSSLHQLDVEGLTERGPSAGRFVGAHERKRLVRYVIEETGGSYSEAGSTAKIRGTVNLATKLRRLTDPDKGSQYRGRLAQMLRDGQEFEVTFDPSDETLADREFISNQHPLVRLAVAELTEQAHQLPRFGEIQVPDLPAGRWLVQVDLVSSQGVRPSCELWFTAIDLDSRERALEIEGQLAAAHAEGRFRDAQESLAGAGFGRSRRDLENRILPERFATTRDERELENAALVEARLNSRRTSLLRRIERDREVLREQRHRHGPANIIRLYEGKIRNLEAELDDLTDEFEPRRHLNMTRSPQALLLVGGA
jgi:superfamily II DNA or RNA helicase